MKKTKSIIGKKFNALQDIYNSFELYNGKQKSDLELQIENLQDKLSSEDFNKLLKAFKSYAKSIFNVFANTKRVFVKLSEEENKTINSNLVDTDFNDFDISFCSQD